MEPIQQEMRQSAAESLQRLCTEEDMAFVGVESGVDTNRARLPCQIVRLPATAIPATLAMAITKGSPYKRILSH
jgi:hypothetical protein